MNCKWHFIVSIMIIFIFLYLISSMLNVSKWKHCCKSLPQFQNNKLNESSQTRARNSFNISPQIAIIDSQAYDLIEANSNLPMKYWNSWKDSNFDMKNNGSTKDACEEVYLIAPHLLRQNNRFWQIVDTELLDNQKTATIRLYLYNAYYDSRIKGNPLVRIIASSGVQRLVEKAQLW